MKRLNGMDAMLLYSETPNLHTHTLKVAIIHAADYRAEHGEPFTFDVFRRTVARRLHLLDPLRYTLVDIPWRLHRPMWLEDCPVDLDYHLRRVDVPSPGGRRELDEVIGRIASTPLDRSRPLWEFHFAEGMADDRFALIGKVHHTLADGVASANLLARLMDLAGSPSTEERDGYDTCDAPSPRELLRAAGRDHMQNVAAIPGVVRDAVRGAVRVSRRSRERDREAEQAKLFRTPPTFLNHVVSPGRTFATASVALAEVKETAKALGVTFNDIVLGTAAGGLRELLLRYDGRADRPILASVPVSTDRSPDRVTGNEISGLAVSLPVHVDDPLERVRLTSRATASAKEVHDLLGPKLQGQMMEYLPPPLAPALFRWQSARAAHNRVMNVAISTVPGPREHGHVGGARVTEIYSVGVLSAGSAFNMTVWSYVDQVDISVLSDDATFGDVHEATDAMIHGLSEIRRAAGLPGLSTVGTAMAPAPALN
ncbi:Diacylglycerol O-acyltransferase [Mycolicibacterium rutilum]|uniref:Diacylglycerol O-acyltransferase n=1 Tax=Mycolicibacterium rutilum TaxID=370526 RepID=A0A1H6K9D9_MYCRU|nr:wax ester/triacylglycerol synthase family O-acyltransferase [Mycolicibacterium rutilum]SEH71658.1 Diacylglycerol O-acyltransferase [Mycolicibacterium rutilum]